MGAWPSLVAGLTAGIAVAVPLGAMGVLLVTTATRVGRAQALAGAAGIATADLIFATVAAVGGATVAQVLAPYLQAARTIAAVLLVIIAIVMIRAALRPAAGPARPVSPRGAFGRFLGLTLLNPATIVTFAGVVVALPAAVVDTTLERLLFVIGAATASMAWQAFLAMAGFTAQRFLGARGQRISGLVGAAMILALAVIALIA